MAGYGEPWHRVREMRDNGPGAEFTHVAVDNDPDETYPENGLPVLESPDEARLARAVRCVNFLAGVPDRVLAGQGVDGELLRLILGVLKYPTDGDAQIALAGWVIERPAVVVDTGSYPVSGGMGGRVLSPPEK
jgi:hypothetical protein